MEDAARRAMASGMSCAGEVWLKTVDKVMGQEKRAEVRLERTPAERKA